jgi:[citrate (pro-3S)-lyase] ligase
LKVVNHGLWGADDNLILNNLIIESETYGEKDIVVIYERAPLAEEIVLLEKLGVHYYDCTKAFHDDQRSKWCIYDNAGHMNAEGYDVTTNYIFDMLERTGYENKETSADVLDIRHDFISDYLQQHTSGEFQRNLQAYIDGIKADFPLTENDKTIGSIVMNCNPFTLGHRYLIEYASQKVDRLYVFVLQEDRSFFRFDDRIVLVRKGTADLENVLVIPSGEFMISALTFPEYFMKDYKKSIDFDATKDLHTFGNYIAKGLGITIRFAGEEPIDVVTAEYNRSMQRLLPEMGIEFHEIPRKTVDGQQVVSASKVRALMAENKWEDIRNYVPETTYQFLVENFKHKGTSH